MYIGSIALLIVIALMVFAYWLVRRKSLTCPHCKSHKRIRTGNRKRVELQKGSIPYIQLYKYNVEYQCRECGMKFWSMIGTEDH